jgi:hypothetical protein
MGRCFFFEQRRSFFSSTVLEQNHQSIKKEHYFILILQVVEGTKLFIKEHPEVPSFLFCKDNLPHPATL